MPEFGPTVEEIPGMVVGDPEGPVVVIGGTETTDGLLTD